jgi:hypothetical protein
VGLLDLLPGFGSHQATPERDEDEIAAEAERLADGAAGSGVTPSVLADDEERSALPLVEYLEDGEQPHHVFRGGELLITDEEGELSRKHPTKQTQVVVTDRRVLFVLGNHRQDEVMEVPLEDVVEAYVDDEDLRRFLVVEADRDGDGMTFFADVTLAARETDLADGVEFVRQRAGRPDA